jgi:hypothetical protein
VAEEIKFNGDKAVRGKAMRAGAGWRLLATKKKGKPGKHLYFVGTLLGTFLETPTTQIAVFRVRKATPAAAAARAKRGSKKSASKKRKSAKRG